jgi:monovalent cation:H+ antiporter, CPA1 family
VTGRICYGLELNLPMSMSLCDAGRRTAIERLDLLSALNNIQLDRVAKLLRPRFTVPNERVLRGGDRGDAVFFIASGAVEVRLPVRHVRLGTGEFFGEMALLTGQPRQADVVALSYCRLLVLRKADFDRFVTTNPDAEPSSTVLPKRGSR